MIRNCSTFEVLLDKNMIDWGRGAETILEQIFVVLTVNLTVRPRWIDEEPQLMSYLEFVPCGRIGPSGGPDVTRGPYV